MERTNNEIVIAGNAANTLNSKSLSATTPSDNFVFVLKKTEKLAAALYAITGFFRDEDPLKWKLRKLGTELLSAGLLMKDTSGDKEKGVMSARNTIEEITSLLLVARHAGLISEMNYEVISREFALIESHITSPEVFGNSVSGHISPEYLKVAEPQKAYETYAAQVPVSEKPEQPVHVPQPTVVKDTEEYVEKQPTQSQVQNTEKPVVQKDREIDESALARMGRTYEPKASKPLREFGAVAVKKNSRQSVIIGILKRKKEIMIKDVTPLIEGVSEKTIQRELLAMVAEGILKKEGEKRWSKYSLA